MRKTWEVTYKDISTVLERHGSTADVQKVFEEFKDHDRVRVEKAVLWYPQRYHQFSAALDELEDIFIEQKLINPPKRFHAPKAQ